MSGKFDIRAIGSADEAGLIALWRTVWTATYGPSLGQVTLKQMLDELDRYRLSSMLPGSGERGYCVVMDGQIVGTAVLAERGTIAYLWGMYIHPDRQRSGIGGKLLAEALNGLATAREIEVRALISSPWAIGFYRKYGFMPQGEEETTLFSSFHTRSLVLRAPIAVARQSLGELHVLPAEQAARTSN